MRGVLSALVALLAVAAFAQEATDYTAAENPFQAEYAFTLGQPIVMRVDIQGVMIETISISAPGAVSTDETVECSVQVAGSNETSKKATLTVVVLLEDASSKALERLSLAPLRIKSRRPIDAQESIEIQNASLASAARAYIFLKVD